MGALREEEEERSIELLIIYFFHLLNTNMERPLFDHLPPKEVLMPNIYCLSSAV